MRSEYDDAIENGDATSYDWTEVLENEDIPKMDMLFDSENGYVYEDCGDGTLTLYKYITDSNSDGNSYINLTVPAEYDGKNVTTIASGAFASGHITSLVISENITTIESGAVASCENLAYIYIPSSVTTIGGYAFSILAYNVEIYCEASEKPDGWSENWNKYREWDDDGVITDEYKSVYWLQSLS